MVDEDVTVIPINAAAIAYFKGPGEAKVRSSTLDSVTLQQVQALLGVKSP